MSSLLLEKNDRISSSKQTKHIKATYFLIKDYYDSGQIDLRYCRTDVIWANILTKPLEGQQFRDMQAFLRNCPRDYSNNIELQTDQLAWRLMNQQVKTDASARECVGKLTNLARKRTRRQGQSLTRVSKLVNDKGEGKVSGKVSCASTQELIVYRKGDRQTDDMCSGSPH
jgi:hypothetical protein